ncbi:MAG: hypothetical protein C5B49_12220 [Bdellovibrio sp.]|nr:MAG: hypothetical protein C5B49_12220 [Bdellovibrio sp.]
MAEFKMWMGYDIYMDFPRPLRIEFWKDDEFAQHRPEAPLHYQADALVGLSLYLLDPHWKNSHLPPRSSLVPQHLWEAREPHFELYQRSQVRTKTLRTMEAIFQDADFEKKWTQTLIKSGSSSGFDLTELFELPALIHGLEDKMKRPLLYNFNLTFDPHFVRNLQYLHSFLFHLRALIAMDYNSTIQDSVHEAVRVDSITDYLPRGEYIVNDALLFLTFSRMKNQLPEKFAIPLEQAFLNFSHNGACLIRGLPAAFLNEMKQELLEETLFLVQMDWLLGTEAGLLYRVREEVEALVEGYDQTFWGDLHHRRTRPPERLSVQCELTEKNRPSLVA